MLFVVSCVPSGTAPPADAGAGGPAQAPAFRPSTNVMKAPFEDSFERAPSARPEAGVVTVNVQEGGARSEAGSSVEAAAPAASSASDDGLGPEWTATSAGVWRVENGRLCGQGARNHGVWLNRTLPVNARVEFDAVSYGPEGDLKAEVWGDGRSSATAISYTNATSYLAILGGWKNTAHVLARIDEHGSDRKEIRVDPASDDPRQKAVNVGQIYHFKVERTDGRKVRWFVDGVEYLSYDDPAPLAGQGHDHFGFNNWQVRVCFDNVRVTPL